MIRIDELQKTYGIHRLVQEVTKQALGTDARITWAERVVESLSLVFPNPEFSNWSLCNRLAPHAEITAQQAAKHGFESEQAARVCFCLGSYLDSQGQYRLTEPLYQQAAETYRTALGEEHPSFATSLNNLAGLYDSMGRYEEAEQVDAQRNQL